MLFRPVVFILSLVVMGVPGAAPGASAEALPMFVKGPLVTVDVRLNGKGPFHMLVDTGASSCSFTAEVARELGVVPEYRVEVLTPGDTRLTGAISSIQVALGSKVETGLQFYWEESWLGSQFGVKVAGVLGQNFLSRFDYKLDFRAKQMWIEPEAGPGSPASRIAFERQDGRMILKGLNREDGPIRLVLDSGASNLSLWHSNVRPEGLVGEAVTYAGRKGVSVGRMAFLVLGRHMIPNLDVVIPQDRIQETENTEDGLLPASLFRSVYVSNSQSFVELTR